MAASAQQRFNASQRRKEVARLYFKRHTQREIAELVGVTQQQVSQDIKALLAEHRAERGQHIEREVSDLNQMELAVERRFEETGDREWVSERRAIKERRAKLLGLDAAAEDVPIVGRIVVTIGHVHAPEEPAPDGGVLPEPPDGD